MNHGAVQDLLTKLAELEASEFDLIQPGTGVMGSIEVAFESTGGGEPATVSYVFYRPLTEGGHAMVVVSARDTVMSVDAKTVNEILGDPAALLKPEEAAEAPADE